LGLSHCIEKSELQLHEKPEVKLSNFNVYDEFFHLCHLTDGSIETKHNLFANGYIKPLRGDSSSEECGLAVKNIGPIMQWFITDFKLKNEPENFIGILLIYKFKL
jgi:hypothetical protein